MYHQIKIQEGLTLEQIISKLKENLPLDWRLENAIAPGRDFYIASSGLSGVFINVKSSESLTVLKFNVCPPNIFLRGLLGFISYKTSKPILEYIYQNFK